MYCARCDYDLRASPDGPCPECGTSFARGDPRSWHSGDRDPDGRRLFATAVVCACLPLVTSAAVAAQAMAAQFGPGFGLSLILHMSSPGGALAALVLCAFRELRPRTGRLAVVLLIIGLGVPAWLLAMDVVAKRMP